MIKEPARGQQSCWKSEKSDGICTGQETVKKAVKSAIQEDDRSKNLIIFGLVETEKEQTDSKVVELLGELGEKPRLTASRIGAMRSGSRPNYCRPVKCSLTNSNVEREFF